MLSFIIIALGGFLTITGAYVQYSNKIQEQRRALENERQRSNDSRELIERTNKILLSQKEVIDQTIVIADLQNKLDDRNREIAKLQTLTIEQLTGGKEVPKLWFLQIAGSSVFVRLYNNSKLPIKNVSVKINRRINDYAETVPVPRNLFPDEEKEYKYKIGDLGISYDELLYTERYKNDYNDIFYDFFVQWQNGFYEGFFLIKKIKNEYQVSLNCIQSYEKGFDLSKAVIINSVFSSVNPEPNDGMRSVFK